MLELAIASGIPIIECRTTDLLNFTAVLKHLTDRKIVAGASVKGPMENVVYWTTKPLEVNAADFATYLENDATLILLNQDEPCTCAFNAGEVPVPPALLASFIEQVVDPTEVDRYVRLAAGLTIKETVEVIKLAQGCYGTITPDGFREFRARVAGAQPGIQQVNSDYSLYIVNSQLQYWAQLNAPYFLTPKDSRLTPRGIVLNGPPGVGKTLGAKYLSSAWGVPLYRLDLSASLGKYVGESEANLSRILSTVDREEPCILLIDEVEKLFSEKDDSGVTTRLLSQLLWWLQEHTSRVLTVMTTNDIVALPKELIRAGRIDRTFSLEGLDQEEAFEFGAQVLDQFAPLKNNPYPPNPSIDDILNSRIYELFLGVPEAKVSHAQIVGAIYGLIKAHKWV